MSAEANEEELARIRQALEALDDHELQRQVVEGKREMRRRLQRTAWPRR